MPGIFTATGTGQGQAAVLNQDGTYNSPSNPAPRGSVIVFYAVGAGAMTPAHNATARCSRVAAIAEARRRP